MKYIILPLFALIGFLLMFVYYLIGYLIAVLWRFDINPRYGGNVGSWGVEQDIKKELNLQSIDDLTWLLLIRYKAIVIIHNTKYYL